jgi:hypothetical protein
MQLVAACVLGGVFLVTFSAPLPGPALEPCQVLLGLVQVPRDSGAGHRRHEVRVLVDEVGQLRLCDACLVRHLPLRPVRLATESGGVKRPRTGGQNGKFAGVTLRRRV